MAKRRAHGEGTIYQRPDGLWVGQHSLGWENGKRRRKPVYGKTQEEVRRKLTDLAKKRDEGEVITTGRKPLLGVFLLAWLEAGAPVARARKKPPSERTLKSYAHHVRTHINPTLEKSRLEALTTPVLQKWVNTLPVGSARGICRTLSAALNYAVQQKLIPRNPLHGVTVPTSGNDKDKHKPFESDEAKAFLKVAMEHRLFALWAVLLGLGFRRGEALRLRRRDVDFKRNTIRVQKGKSESSRRTLVMPKFVMTALREHLTIGNEVALIDPAKLRAARLAAGLNQGELAGKADIHFAYVSKLERGVERVGGRGAAAVSRQVMRRLTSALGVSASNLVVAPAEFGPDDPIFLTKTGEPFPDNTSYVNKEFHKLLREAGLEDRRPHDLRHSFATLMLELGEELAVVSEMLGHQDMHITKEYYAHVRRGLKERAASRMDDLLGQDA